MRQFMFSCPHTGYIVHGQAVDAIPGEKPHMFHPVSALLADEVILLILQRLSLQSEESRALGLTWPRSRRFLFGSRSAMARTGRTACEDAKPDSEVGPYGTMRSLIAILLRSFGSRTPARAPSMIR
jgi:hypothetical protein